MPRRTNLSTLQFLYELVRRGDALPPLREEIELQTVVVAWCRHQCPDPRAAAIYGMAHEGDLTKAARYRVRMQGVVNGQPDLILPVPSGSYGALYIELKWGGNDITQDQFDFLRHMERMGNAVTVEWSLETVKARVLEYLSDPEYFVGGP